MLRQIFFASSLFLLNACATKIDGLQVSDSFTASNLKSKSLVTGGVVDSKTVLSRGDSNAYAGVMLSQIKDERSFVKTQPVETLINAVGEDQYSALLAKYSASGLDAAALGELSAKLPDVQFVALAKIENDTTAKSTKETPASESKDDKGKVTKTEASLQQIHSRTVNASVHIYDLKAKNTAFSGQLSKTLSESKSYNPDGVRGVINLVNTIRGADQEKAFPYPEAPGTRAVLAEIFEGFAENFPKE